jgi:transcriptional regulator with XRE-family HTH domain
MKKRNFGNYVRKRREKLGARGRQYSLRKVSERIGIQPSYLSKIERGLEPPPGEKTIRRLAEVLEEDTDLLLAMAGKVSTDLQTIILQRPELFARILREIKDVPERSILRVVREVRDGKW